MTTENRVEVEIVLQNRSPSFFFRSFPALTGGKRRIHVGG